ncbi:MAG TPA: hypothetical protein VKP60_22385 [Magnetospirillaceae bacterium]|nr:hypothetical protein [Magnetospirillaceae bacterium]
MRILTLLALCLPLLTTGCFVGDGIAHVVKLANKSGNKSDESGQTASAQPAPVQPAPASAAPIDRDPAPMPATAPAIGIQSEELAPPRS